MPDVMDELHAAQPCPVIDRPKEAPRTSMIGIRSVRKLDWNSWHGKIRTATPIMCGHSLGGSAAISSAADSRFSFAHIIAYDPAVQRKHSRFPQLSDLMIYLRHRSLGKRYPVTSSRRQL